MTQALQVFENADFGVIRTLEEDGKVLFCGSDAARALGYINPRDALRQHCKGVVKRDTLTNGGIQEMTFIPEGDLYRLIVGSRLPAAEQFERWVFDEVLPTIRRTGTYSVSPPPAKSIREVYDLIKLYTETMHAQNARPEDVAEVQESMAQQFGVRLPECFVHPEKLTMKDVDDMITFIFQNPRGRGRRRPTYDDFIVSKITIEGKCLEGGEKDA